MYLRVSPYHEIIEGIITALEVNEGIIKLTGRAGTGKSSLCKQLFQQLESQKQIVLYFSNPPRSADDLQHQISAFLGLNTQSSFTKTLTAYLLSKNPGERHLYLIFDEAQGIDEQTFNAIRMLCNIQDRHLALVKPVICGSEDLNEKLSTSTYRSVMQYLSQSFTLPPMSIEQLKDFYWTFWVSQNIEIQPPTTRLIATLFKQTLGFPGPALQKLNEALDSMPDNKHARLDQVSKRQAGLRADKRCKNGSNPASRRVLMFGCLLLVIGGVMYVLYNKVATQTLVMASVPVAAAPAEPATPVQVTTSIEPAPSPEPELQMTASRSEEFVPSLESIEVGDDLPAIATSDATVEQVVADATPVVAAAAVAESASEAVNVLLVDWSSRWQDKDVDGYLGFYHPDFTSTSGDTLEVWQQQRRNSINRATDIRISYDNLEILDETTDAMLVQFWLRYSSSTYGDDTLKQLLLLNTPAGWRIRSERNLRVERTQ